jgi:ribosome-associated protein
VNRRFRRQLKYATKLLRDKSVDELYEFLAQKKGSLLKKNREFHDLEHLRNLLVDEAVQHYEDMMHNDGYINENEPSDLFRKSEALNVIVGHFPDIDQALLKNAAIQFARTRNRKFSRELFRILKAALEKKQFSKIEGKINGV